MMVQEWVWELGLAWKCEGTSGRRAPLASYALDEIIMQYRELCSCLVTMRGTGQRVSKAQMEGV